MAKQKLDYGFSHYMMFCTLMKDPKACAWLIEKILPGKEIENVITDGHDLTENMTESQIEKTDAVYGRPEPAAQGEILFQSARYGNARLGRRIRKAAPKVYYFHMHFRPDGVKQTGIYVQNDRGGACGRRKYRIEFK